MAEIVLTNGMKTTVDDEFLPYLNRWFWSYHNGYAYRYEGACGDRKRIWLHRVVVGIYNDELVVDHIDGDTLKNTEMNLRICTPSENSKNSSQPVTSNNKYKGVTKRGENFRVRVSVNGRTQSVGTYTNEIAGANAYNYFAREVYGQFARLNDVPYMSKEEVELYRV